MRQPIPFKWRGPHHSYLGIAFIIFGAVFSFLNWGNNLDFLNYIFGVALGLGVILLVDDIYEHIISGDSPCRILWELILRLKND